MKKYIVLIIMILLVTGNLYSQDWKLSGQIQLRTELDGRDFSNRTHPLTFASLRTRVGVEKSLADKITFFAQLQDSRVLGQEASVVSNSANVDLHQGYVMLTNLFDWKWSLQAGRFVVSYGTERFLGASEWNYIGRAWDGVRLSFQPGFQLDLFGLTEKEPVAYVNFASPDIYPYPDEPTPSRSVYGFYTGWNYTEMNKFEILGYYDVDRHTDDNDNLALKRFNLAGTYYGNFEQFSLTAEAGLQFGKQYTNDISAYLLSLQGLFNANPLKVGAGIDILSGSTDLSGKNTFAVPYATNHKFYGFMDYFNGAPLAGLDDIYLMAFLAPSDSKFSGSLYFHYFKSNKSIEVITIPPPPALPSRVTYSTYGQEIDLTIKYAILENAGLTWGGSLFVPGDLMKILYSGDNYTREDTGFWTYLMITANF